MLKMLHQPVQFAVDSLCSMIIVIVSQICRSRLPQHAQLYHDRLAQIMADADKERVAKLKADMPPVPKHIKAAATKEAKAAAKETKAAKLPRAKTAYLVQFNTTQYSLMLHLPGTISFCMMLPVQPAHDTNLP